ncbi:hypothetical protein BKA93DRAFT_705858, partial [Sparassis latifolia]
AKHSNSDTFWKKHYFAVALVKGETGDQKKPRKTHACTRCKAIMWPGLEGSPENHRRSYCADGARQKPKKVQRVVDGKTVMVTEQSPEFPQPPGVFMDGTHFHPGVFLKMVECMYEQLVVQKGSLAFAVLLEKRLKIHP